MLAPIELTCVRLGGKTLHDEGMLQPYSKRITLRSLQFLAKVISTINIDLTDAFHPDAPLTASYAAIDCQKPHLVYDSPSPRDGLTATQDPEERDAPQ